MTASQPPPTPPAHPARSCPTRASRRAMTLIEVIGVLAIIAILAAVLLPAFIKEADQAAANRESASLQSFADAFQRSVMRNRRIPGAAGFDWATNVAAELGLVVAGVTNNVRQEPRVLLIDTNGFGAMTLPYAQTDTGTALPANSGFGPRLMIISSLGVALPNTLANLDSAANGGLLTSDFNNLWNWDSTPAHFPTNGVWGGWTGNANDITLQRLNLSALLLSLWLSYYPTQFNSLACSYAMDANPVVAVGNGPNTNYLHSYYLQSSVLNLYYISTNDTLVLDSQQVLNQNSSFVFYENEWRQAVGIPPTNAVTGGSGGGGGPGGGTNGINNFDFTGLVNGFLAATPTSLGSSQLTNVVQSFIAYMTNYDAWAAASFPSGTLYNNALNAQTTMMGYINNLVGSIVVH